MRTIGVGPFLHAAVGHSECGRALGDPVHVGDLLLGAAGRPAPRQSVPAPALERGRLHLSALGIVKAALSVRHSVHKVSLVKVPGDEGHPALPRLGPLSPISLVGPSAHRILGLEDDGSLAVRPAVQCCARVGTDIQFERAFFGLEVFRTMTMRDAFKKMGNGFDRFY